MSDDNALVRAILEVAKPIFVGCSGGVAALFVSRTKPTLLALVSCVFVSGFAGWMVAELCVALGVHTNFTSVATGIGGFYGPVTLRSLGKLVGGKLGLDLDSPRIQAEPAPCADTVPCGDDEEDLTEKINAMVSGAAGKKRPDNNKV